MYDISIIAYNGFQSSALFGLSELFDLANARLKLKCQDNFFNVFFTTSQGQPVYDYLYRPIKNITGKIAGIKNCDAVIFLGTMPCYEKDLSINFLSKEEIDWIKEKKSKETLIASMLSGTFLLAEAGILEGREFSLYKPYTNTFTRKHPDLSPDQFIFTTKDEYLLTGPTITSWLNIGIEVIKDALGNDAEELLSDLSIMHAPSEVYKRNNTPASCNNKFLLTIKDIIEKPENTNITINQLASMLSISERTLGRKIKYHTNKSSKQFIDDIRIEKACRLLKKTDKQIKEIAFLCGYKSDFVFRRAFIRKVGICPSEYKSN